ncbi:MAG: thiamine-phosphate kinase [Elusimicrobia bacterium]|nr:thiamine-phosphate kinase [Elusimicrobiota bacterium]
MAIPANTELEIIGWIFRRLGGKSISFDLGDDAAVIKVGGRNLAVSIDSFSEGIHFNKKIPFFNVGWRAVAAAASDIVAMGFRPEFIFVSLGLKKENPLATAKKIYRGISSACGKFGIKVAGGDTVRSGKIFLSVCAAGSGGKEVRRSGAREGDVVFVTDYPGLASAGFDSLSGKRKKYPSLEKKFMRPIIKPRFAATIAPFSNSLIDSSDGLLASCFFISRMSGVRIDLDRDKVPLSPDLLKFSPTRKAAFDYALTGGEDFCLVGTTNSEKFAKIKEKVFKIGEVRAGKGVFLDGKRTGFRGFRHFA